MPGPTPKKDALVFAVAFFVLVWKAPDLERFLYNPDQGYQLSLGQQILLGRFPFVDLMFVYGPLTAFTSAGALRIFDNLIGEILVSAFFYAASLFLLHKLAYKHVTKLASWVVPVLGLFLLGRFHKWYVWFFPLAALYCFSRQLDDRDSSLRWWAVGGLVCGIGALYRLDYGLALCVFFSILALSPRLTHCADGTFWRQRCAVLVAAFLVPLLLWLGILGAVGGGSAIDNYFVATFEGGAGAVTDWSVPFPDFVVSDPFGLASAQVLALFLLPLTYLICLGTGGWYGYLQSGEEVPRERFLAALGLIGLAIYPHGAYRADVSHLLQIVPPMLLAAPAVLSRGWRWARTRSDSLPPRMSRPLLAAVTIYAALLGSTASLLQNPPGDLTSIESNPVARYRNLARESGAVENSTDVRAQIARQIGQRTNPDDPILVIAYAPQLYYFTRRPLSGLLNAYFAGVHDDENTRLRNLEHVRRHPPALVVATSSFEQMPADNDFRRSQPELYDFLANRYTTTIYSRGRWALLGPGAN